jgi:hypothetical protein
MKKALVVFAMLVFAVALLTCSNQEIAEQNLNSACKQMYIAGEGGGTIDSHGQKLCECASVRLGKELSVKQIQSATELLQLVAKGSDADVDLWASKTKRQFPNLPEKVLSTIGISGECHPHMEPIPDP